MKKNSSLISSILLIVIGLVLLLNSDEMLVTISYIIGVLTLAFGIYEIVKFKTLSLFVELPYGIFCLVAGLILMIFPGLLVSLIPIFIGLWIVIKSIFKIKLLLSCKTDTKEWYTPFITSILTLIIGIVVLLNPFRTVSSILKIIGIVMIIYSSIDIYETYFITKKIKNPDVF